MTEQEFEKWLKEAIFLMNEEGQEVKRIQTFEEAGLLTRDSGLVIRTDDGKEFQLTISER